MKFGMDIHGPQYINPDQFSESLTFLLEPPTGNIFMYSVIYLSIYYSIWINLTYIQVYFGDPLTFQLKPQ